MRYYMLDRLQPIEKKILLEYILDKYIVNADNGSMKEPSIERYRHLEGGTSYNRLFYSKFWINRNTNLYIISHDHVYYRYMNFRRVNEIYTNSAHESNILME